MSNQIESQTERARMDAPTVDNEWYKDAVIYQLHVRSFRDSSGDGVGDFIGLTQKLDYLQDLGVTAIWLMPFYPSPLRDDGYDIADYGNVNPSYGTMRDFRLFVQEAHARGLRVITELVINHTSDQHPWFQAARRAKLGDPEREIYVWSDNPDRYPEARIIFKDFETSNWSWDPVAQSYFWHRFYHHQPDLNFDNPEVHRRIIENMDFWMEMGVDGLRLDAIPYLYERDGTNCDNLPETHAFLKKLRTHIDAHYPGRMLLAEANQWPEDAVAYYGDGDECHTAFHFPVMPRLFMAVHMEDRLPIIDILEQTPAIPEICQWVMFLRNHDEMTLEMVTDEERDYMYRAYAHDPQARINLGIRRRLAPLLGNNRQKIELLNGLLFSLPGTPVIYYGDEIGMGDNIYLGDRHGVRTPMQWSPDRNAGFSEANPQRLYSPVIIDADYRYETINVETQQNNPHSLLWWMKRLISARQRLPVFGRGTFEPLSADNPKVLAFVRRSPEQTVLVVANLSRHAQAVEMDLSGYGPAIPLEVFGKTKFPKIGVAPYSMTLTPYAFFYFELIPDIRAISKEISVPSIRLPNGIDVAETFADAGLSILSKELKRILPRFAWMQRETRNLESAAINDVVILDKTDSNSRLALLILDLRYDTGDSERISIPVGLVSGSTIKNQIDAVPSALLAKFVDPQGELIGILRDATLVPERMNKFLDVISSNRSLAAKHGELRFWSTPELDEDLNAIGANVIPRLLDTEPSNSTILFGDRLILKILTKLEVGIDPELELGRQLREQGVFDRIVPLRGAVEYFSETGQTTTLAMVEQYIPDSVSVKHHVADRFQRFLEFWMTKPGNESISATVGTTAENLLVAARSEVPSDIVNLLGGFLDTAGLLGKRTAELHAALATIPGEDFRPIPANAGQMRSIYQTIRRSLVSSLQNIKQHKHDYSPRVVELASTIERHRSRLFKELEVLLEKRDWGAHIRCHGDCHLSQILYDGKDFLFFDFEGIPGRPLVIRRGKASPLTDIASLLRSFHYALWKVIRETGYDTRPETYQSLREAARIWYGWSASAILRSYLQSLTDARLLPVAAVDLGQLLHIYLLQRAIFELEYELEHRPDRVEIPLYGILAELQIEPENAPS